MKKISSMLNIVLIFSLVFSLLSIGRSAQTAQAQFEPPTPKLRNVVNDMLDALPISGAATTQFAASQKIDPALRQAALEGGEDFVDIMVSYRGAPDLSKLITNPVIRPEIFPGMTYVFGQAKIGDILKMAFTPGVISIVDASLSDLERPFDADSKIPPDPEAVQERLQYLLENELTYQEAYLKVNGDVGGSGWFDVLDGHQSSKAWEKGFTGQGVIVGMVDDGVDFAHPDLMGTYAVVTDPDSTYYGWPMAFSQASTQYFVYDVLFGTNYIASGATASRWGDAQTEVSPVDGQVSYKPLGSAVTRNYQVVPGSKSGIYKIGSLPERNLQAVFGHRVAVLVVDMNVAGVYDTVFVDLDNDKSFLDEKPVTREDPTIYRDLDGDGLTDISGGILVWISDGDNPPPVVDWLWGIGCGDASATQKGCPDSGELLLFAGSFRAGYTHGTQCASNVNAQGVVSQGLSSQPFRNGGMVQGAAPEARIMDFGDFYQQFASEDHYLVAALGYDGTPQSGDEVQIASNSYGSFTQMWGGWGYTGRMLTALNLVLAPSTVYVFSAGNEGPGFGPQEGDGGPTTIMAGSSTQYGSTNWDSIFSADQIVYGDPNSFFSHGPNRDGSSGLDLLGNGGRGAGDEGINYYGFNGAESWATWGGTSRSAPVVSGNLALLYQAYKARNGVWPTWDVVKGIAKSGASNSVSSPFLQGAGVVNADRATDIAAGLYGVYATPDEWQVGDWEGVEYLNFAKVAYPGDTFTKAYTVYNPSDHEITVDLSDGVMQKVSDYELTFTTSDFSKESQFNFHAPQYLMELDSSTIPADAEVMVVRYVHTYDTFDPNYMFSGTPTSSWRFMLYNWTDHNLDGKLWEDTNANGTVNYANDMASGYDNDGFLRPDFSDPTTEIQEGEYVRMDYQFGGNGIPIFVRDPLGRMADGYFFGFQHRRVSATVPQTTFTIGVEFYKRADWSWLSLSDSNLTIDPRSSNTFDATMVIPMGTPPGAYEGVIFMYDPGQPAYDHPVHESALPVVVNVIADMPDGGSVTLGNEATPADTFYQNSFTHGYFNWYGGGWTGAGDWRHYFMNIDENDILQSKLMVHTYWYDNYPTDINTHVLGPTADCASNGVNPCAFWQPGLGQPDPSIYGPYTLLPIASSEPFRSGATYPFYTSTDGPDDWMIVPLDQAGLYEIALHNVLYSGEELIARFGVDVGTIGMDADIDPGLGFVEFGSINATVYDEQGSFDLLFTPTIAIPDLMAELSGGLATTMYGPFTEFVVDNGGNYSAWHPLNTVTPFMVTATGVTQLKTHLIMTAGQDADYFLVFDANNNGILEQGIDTLVGSSGNGTGEDEEIVVLNPTLGRYFSIIAGYDVDPDTGINLDWWYSITAPGDLSSEENVYYEDTPAIDQDDDTDFTTASFVYTLVTDERSKAIHVTVENIPAGADVDLYLTDGANNILAESKEAGDTSESIDWYPDPGDLRFGAGETFKVWVHGVDVPTPPVTPDVKIWTDDLNIWLSSPHPYVEYNSTGISADETVTLTVNFAKDDWMPGDDDLSARVKVGPSVLPGAFDELIVIKRSEPATPKAVFEVEKSATSTRGDYPLLINNPYFGPTPGVLAAPGDLITYYIRIENVGDLAGDFYFEDYWGDTRFDFVSWVDSPTYKGVVSVSGWELLWGGDTLAAGDTVTYKYIVQATGMVLNSAYVNYIDIYGEDDVDPVDGDAYYAVYRNFSTSATTGLPAYSDKISITNMPGKVAPGEMFEYQILLTNPSSVDQVVYVSDPLPVGVNYVMGGAGVTYNAVTHTVKWSGSVPGSANDVTVVSFMVQAKGNLAEKTILSNTAYVSLTDGGAPFGAFSDTLVVDDGSDPSLSVVKYVDKLVAAVGDELQYTIMIENTGSETAKNAHLVDALPSYLQIIPESITGGAYYQDGAIHWEDDIPAGGFFYITYRVKIVGGSLKLAIINGVTLTVDGTAWWLFNSAATELLGGLWIYLPLMFSSP
jgi:uncharacterized repeat protein (TIGR01451 family)